MRLLLVVFSFVMLLLSTNANAFSCYAKSSGKSIGTGGGTATVNVSLNPVVNSGTTTIYDASKDLSCSANDTYPTHYYDDLYVESVTTAFPNTSNYTLGMIAVGKSYNLPYNGSEIYLFTVDGYYHSTQYLPLVFNITPGGSVTDPIAIHKGDLLYTINLKQHSSVDGDHYYTWRIVAANDVYVVTTTCTINNNQQINIDFGMVQSASIGATLSTTSATIQRDIPVHCTNTASVNAHMDVYAAAASGFTEPNAITTTDSNLGVVISKEGQSLPVNKASSASFPITNGDGHISLDINLIKKSDSVTLAGGAFSASATLILAAD